MEQVYFDRLAKIGAYPYFTFKSQEMHYFVNYQGSHAYLFVESEQEFFLFTDGRYYEEYLEKIPQGRLILLNSLVAPLEEALDWIFQHRKTKEVFLSYQDISFDQGIKIQQMMSNRNIKIQDIGNRIIELISMKDETEQNMMLAAQRIAEQALAQGFQVIREGVKEIEVAAEIEYTMRIKGASGTSFSTIVQFGENGAFPHKRPTQRALKSGDVILIDLGAKLQGYSSDMTRTVIYRRSKHAFDFVEKYEYLLALQEKAVKACVEGVELASLDQMIRDQFEKDGLLGFYPHSLGHGVGMDIHEYPRLSFQRKGIVAKKGMVLTVEPGLYFPHKYGIRIEDFIAIHPKTGETVIFSQFPKDLLDLGE